MDLLINVYEQFSTFEKCNPVGITGEFLCKVNASYRSYVGPSIVDKSTFFHNWRVFTMGSFLGVNWNNLFVAGGAVLGPLLPGTIPKYCES
jgi:hypothetical protein